MRFKKDSSINGDNIWAYDCLIGIFQIIIFKTKTELSERCFNYIVKKIKKVTALIDGGFT